ncbi:hypothetical protein [Chitiniphilus shinanonensis]|uniref:hypothetical protein n=1 Tax=Chitiniphilus shinanonensis TaxID=553088 RepID=UPI0030214130
MVAVPDWLANDVLSFLQRAFTLRLPGSPPQDSLQATAATWIESMEIGARSIHGGSLHWDRAADQVRIAQAMKDLLREAERWPVPAQLIKRLGARDSPPALPAPPLSEEQMARNRARIQDLLALVGRGSHPKEKSNGT